MRNLAFRPARIARWVLALAAGIAMLMPLPARCLACVAAAGTCPHCVAANPATETPPAPKACCQHRTTQAASPIADVDAPTVKHAAHACGCILRTAPRTVPTVEKLILSANQVAVHGAAACVANPSINSAAASVRAPGDLPPSVPHRILHCSWII
jgi:hypothetical protein